MNAQPGQASRLSREQLRKTALGSPAGFLAFGFGSGLSPWAPGTIGTLVAVPFALLIRSLDSAWFWVTLLLTFFAGVLICARVSDRLGVHDHGGIVWDEFVGYWLAVAFVPCRWQWFLAAFLLFRFFDILKPWPIRQLDEKTGGGFGIMIDDVIAGLYTLVLLAAVTKIPGYQSV